MKKFLIIWAVILVLVGTGLGGFYYYKNRSTSDIQTGAPAPAAKPAKNTQDQQDGSIRLLATGDMIAHDSINANAQKAGANYDYAALMNDMKPYFAKGDINFCNQSTPAGGETFGITGYPVFNAPIAFARGLEEVGCNVINIGTNHTNDKGQALVDATVAAWDNREVLAVAGANRSSEEQAMLRTFEIEGVEFAFVAYTDYTNVPLPNNYGVNRYSLELARTQIAEARKTADFVIASIRWGTEYSPDINARQDQVAQELADAGADVILGHGTHVLQPVKRLTAIDKRQVYVWYGLGNFLNSQVETEALIGGFASMEISPETKSVDSIGFLPVYQHYDWSAADKAAGNLLARKNFTMVPLDRAADLLAASQLGTTVEQQTTRVREVLNKYTEVPILISTNF